ncbi:aspartate/glutamate racemase family protein [Salinibacillus xinjiangensis]|uniref:Asp/Glu/hydantoin racemase n=1 Tax=Salinibacillus xinjiangensis TaxID=1229268 RepID=A0A6G1X1P8_9BACI|nr:aspartate/glutamate racemase family protein [Salinibacillus xinjiangensis]MRG84911.1 hypothetical protein [Salinibacillus xinjiangensis]
MKVGLIHALTSSVPPIEKAFYEIAPEVELVHVMDTELLSMIKREQTQSPQIIRRFSKLIHLVTESKVDCIQFTCSAFNNLTTIFQPMSEVRLFRSDEAMLDVALQYERIGLISTVEETPPVLIHYLRQRKPSIEIQTMVNTEGLQALNRGDQDNHDELVLDMMKQLEPEVDAIVLSQYSLSHLATKVESSIPILTGPKESAKRCLRYLQPVNKN